MKKLMFMALAAVAMSFAACGGKTGATAEPDTLALAPEEQAATVVALLEEQLQNADPAQVKEISEMISEQVAAYIAAGNEAAAEAYTNAINTFIVENAEQLQATGNDVVSSVAGAITSVANLPLNILDATTAAAVSVSDEAAAQAAAAEATVDAAAAAVEAAPAAAAAAVKAQAEAVDAAAKAQADAAAAAAKAQAAAAQQKVKDDANKAIDDAAAAAKKKLGL